uniref:Cytochrome b561 domain-containing protein n=1 Tax=Rhizochromulina marina TaxID=1034831 RepID=A0A7S2ST69_9STRA
MPGGAALLSGVAGGVRGQAAAPPVADPRGGQPVAVVRKPCALGSLLTLHSVVLVTALCMFAWASGKASESHFLGGLSPGGPRLFNWHPVLMTWGFCLLTEGAVAYRGLRFTRHGRRMRVHWALMSAGIACWLLGLVAVGVAGEEHLRSTHSWVGLATLCLASFQFLLGLLVFLRPGSSFSLKRRLYPLHTALGVSTVVVASAAVLTGIDHKTSAIGCTSAEGRTALQGCQLAGLVALLVVLVSVLAVYVLYNLKQQRTSAPRRQAGDEAAGAVSRAAGGESPSALGTADHVPLTPRKAGSGGSLHSPRSTSSWSVSGMLAGLLTAGLADDESESWDGFEGDETGALLG